MFFCLDGYYLRFITQRHCISNVFILNTFVGFDKAVALNRAIPCYRMKLS